MRTQTNIKSACRYALGVALTIAVALACGPKQAATKIPEHLATSVCVLEMLPDARPILKRAKVNVASLRDSIANETRIEAEAIRGLLELVTLAERVQACLDRIQK